MNYKLNVVNGKVKYIAKREGGNVGSDTTTDAIYKMLNRGEPHKSDEFEGYPIVVAVNGTEYHISGEWLMGAEKDVLGEDASESPAKVACGPDYCEIDPGEGYSRKGADKPQKRRRAKDVVYE